MATDLDFEKVQTLRRAIRYDNWEEVQSLVAAELLVPRIDSKRVPLEPPDCSSRHGKSRSTGLYPAADSEDDGY
jgi:hypothetical protein